MADDLWAETAVILLLLINIPVQLCVFFFLPVPVLKYTFDVGPSFSPQTFESCDYEKMH